MIKNIIFDLCGPIITIDITLIDKALQRLGALSPQPYLELYHAGVTKQFESGLITDVEFCQEVRSRLSISAPDAAIAHAWNTLIVSFDPRNADFVRRMHQNHRTFLLSNSDVFNAHHFHDYLNAQTGRDFMEEDFDEYCFSYRLGKRKPDPEIFRHLLLSHNLQPEETLFVDDCQKHCQGAAALGIQTHFLQRGQRLFELRIS